MPSEIDAMLDRYEDRSITGDTGGEAADNEIIDVCMTDDTGLPGKPVKMRVKDFNEGRYIPINDSKPLPLAKSSAKASGSRKTSKKAAKETEAAESTDSEILSELGLDFITPNPSPAGIAVKLIIEKPFRFSANLMCHHAVLNDALVILVLDTRANADLMELTLEDSTAETVLEMPDGNRIPVHPPTELLHYDVGKLRHFLFIRNNG